MGMDSSRIIGCGSGGNNIIAEDFGVVDDNAFDVKVVGEVKTVLGLLLAPPPPPPESSSPKSAKFILTS